MTRQYMFLLACALCAVAVIWLLYLPFPWDDTRVKDMARIIRQYDSALEEHVVKVGALPADLNELAESARHHLGMGEAWFNEGRDLWGTPLLYWRAPDGSKAKLWSAGPNRTDEAGAGDDLLAECDVAELRRLIGPITASTTTSPSRHEAGDE